MAMGIRLNRDETCKSGLFRFCANFFGKIENAFVPLFIFFAKLKKTGSFSGPPSDVKK